MLLFCAVMLLFQMPVQARAESFKTVKVGYYTSSGFLEGDSVSAPRSGYGYEYLQKVASYAGWKYEYVPGTWADLYDALKRGEIDLLPGVAFSDARTEEVLFPDSEMLKETFYIYKDNDNTALQTGNPQSFQGQKIGVVENAQMQQSLETWMAQNHVQLEEIVYPDLQSCADAFNANEITGFVSADNIVSGTSGISPAEMIGRVPYYICVSPARPDLLTDLNAALLLINGQDSVYLANLKNKYSADTSISIFLSRQESDWMQAHPQLRVGYLSNYMPYSGTAPDGSAEGLLCDLLIDLFDRLPGSYTPQILYTAYSSQENLIDALQQGQVDLIFPVNGELHYAEENGYRQSSVVLQAGVNLLYTGNYTAAKLNRIAVNQNNLMQLEYTRANYPDSEIVWCATVQDCMQAVKQGRADCTLVESLRAVSLTEEGRKMQSLPLSNAFDFCFGVSYGDQGLLRILNHGLSMLGDEYALTHAYQYIGSIVSNTMEDVLRHALLIAFVLAVILWLLWTLFMRYRALRRLSRAEAEHSRLLQEALVKAHQADYAKRAFLHNMSHDIRTPLNALMGVLEIEDRSQDPAVRKEYREKARHSIAQLTTMTDRMIRMSKLESGEAVDLHETVDLARITEEVALIQKAHAKENGLTFVHECKDDRSTWPCVYSNAMYLHEILTNSLENAIKYNRPQGQIVWKEELCLLSAEKAEYRCTIQDTGVGMTAEYLQHIYEPFSQEHHDARTTYHGSGLGMTIVKSLLDAMHGSIQIESRENAGTAVSLCIPLEICPAAACQSARAQSEPVSAPEKREAPADLTGKSILLVEDNGLNIEIEQFLLEQAGAHVTVAKDGAEAVRLYTSSDARFDTVLMDIMMPVMNGYEAARAIRTSGCEDAETLPIIATTACVSEDVRREGAAVGFSDYIEKPLDLNKLLQAIARLSALRS